MINLSEAEWTPLGWLIFLLENNFGHLCRGKFIPYICLPHSRLSKLPSPEYRFKYDKLNCRSVHRSIIYHNSFCQQNPGARALISVILVEARFVPENESFVFRNCERLVWTQLRVCVVLHGLDLNKVNVYPWCKYSPGKRVLQVTHKREGNLAAFGYSKVVKYSRTFAWTGTRRLSSRNPVHHPRWSKTRKYIVKLAIKYLALRSLGAWSH